MNSVNVSRKKFSALVLQEMYEDQLGEFAGLHWGLGRSIGVKSKSS